MNKNGKNQKKHTKFVHNLNGQLFRYTFMTFILQDNQVLKLINIFPYYRNQTGNMGPYYPCEDKLTHHAHCALHVFAWMWGMFLDLKSVYGFILFGFRPIGWKYSCLPSDKTVYYTSLKCSWTKSCQFFCHFLGKGAFRYGTVHILYNVIVPVYLILFLWILSLLL